MSEVSQAVSQQVRNETLDMLERVLREQHALHKKIQSCIERKRNAIRIAQIEEITAICEEENELVQKQGELEKARLMILGRITEMVNPRAERPLTLQEVADIAPGERAERLLQLREALRELVDEVRRSSKIVRMASEKLNHHMVGIMQTVHSALSRAGVYGDKGRVAVGAQLDFSVDVKS